MKTLTENDEERLQAVAHELEQIAEELRSRALRGRVVGVLADLSERLRRMSTLVEAVGE
jgi:hypothetical protein